MQLNICRVLTSLAIACLAVIVAATPADARRKFGSGSKSSSSSSSSTRAPAAAAKSNWSGPMMGVALMRATRARLSKVFELPATDSNRLEDGRHFHIGRLARSLFGSKYVGYVTYNEYVELPSEKLQSLLFSVGFNSVAEFEEHLASQPPLKPDPVTPEEMAAEPAEAAEGLGTLQKASLAAAVLTLAGVLGFFFISWRRNRSEAPSPAPAAVARTARVAAVRTPAAAAAAPALRAPTPQPVTPPRPAAAARVMPQPLPPVQRTPAPAATPLRRAPRDLSALTRPKPA